VIQEWKLLAQSALAWQPLRPMLLSQRLRIKPSKKQRLGWDRASEAPTNPTN